MNPRARQPPENNPENKWVPKTQRGRSPTGCGPFPDKYKSVHEFLDSCHFPAAGEPGNLKSEAVLTLGFEALAAVHGTISAGLEGDLSLTAAAIADHGVHLAGAIAVAVLSPTGSAAGGAAAGLILEALLSKELLLAGGEHELIAAVTAGQGFVFVHGNTLLKMLFTRTIGEEESSVPDNGYEKQPWRK